MHEVWYMEKAQATGQDSKVKQPLTTLAEDVGLVPSIHMVAYNHP